MMFIFAFIFGASMPLIFVTLWSFLRWENMFSGEWWFTFRFSIVFGIIFEILWLLSLAGDQP